MLVPTRSVIPSRVPSSPSPTKTPGLYCMYEVLATMSVLMAPITPFFSEYTYTKLRECHPSKDDSSLPEDAPGRATSVHMLMIPPIDESR